MGAEVAHQKRDRLRPIPFFSCRRSEQGFARNKMCATIKLRCSNINHRINGQCQTFLSYSRDDSLAMGILRDNLRKLGFNLWIDIEHLEPGTPQWVRAVREAIRNTDGMLVLCSPSAERSEWVNREVHEARAILREDARRMKLIVPVLVSGTEADSIPFELVGDQYCDMRGRADPDRGFRELVTRFATTFDLDVPDYRLETSGGMQNPCRAGDQHPGARGRPRDRYRARCVRRGQRGEGRYSSAHDHLTSRCAAPQSAVISPTGNRSLHARWGPCH